MTVFCRCLLFCVFIFAGCSEGWAQQRPTAPSVLDTQALRREATQLQELRTILADPDPNFRLLALRAIARGTDPLQKRIAVQLGLASADAEIHEMALRVLLSSVADIRLELIDADGQPLQPSDGNTLLQILLKVATFDVDSGKIAGTIPGTSCSTFTGAIPGPTLVWANPNNYCSGELRYNQEAGEFRGSINLESGRATGLKLVRWRHR